MLEVLPTPMSPIGQVNLWVFNVAIRNCQECNEPGKLALSPSTLSFVLCGLVLVQIQLLLIAVDLV